MVFILILFFQPPEIFGNNIVIVTKDSVTSNSNQTHTIPNFQITAGGDGLLLVGVVLKGDFLTDITSVTFGDQNLTEEISEIRGLSRVSIFRLVNPDIETNDIVVNTGLDATAIIGAIYMVGVDTGNPITSSNSTNGFSKTPDVSITTSSSFMMVFDILGTFPPVTPSTNPSQTEQWNLNILPTTLSGASSTKLVQNPSTTSMNWSLNLLLVPTDENWILASVAVKEKPARYFSESLGLSDNLSSSTHRAISISESLGLSDNLSSSTHRAISISESLGLSDNLSSSTHRAISLSESLGLSESISTFTVKIIHNQIILHESFTVNDEFSLKGSLRIESKTNNSILLDGVTFLISPSPINGTGTYLITDGDINDFNPTPGIIQIPNVPLNDYQIIMNNPPSGFLALNNQTNISVWESSLFPLTSFIFFEETSDTSTLEPTLVSSPTLNSTNFANLVNLNGLVVSQADNLVNSPNDLPGIISVGKNNLSGLNIAKNQQSNLKIITGISKGSTGTSILNAVKIPSYVLPSDSKITVVVPPVVIEGNESQIVVMPPIKKIISGQSMVLPVKESLIPIFGGVSELKITSSISSVSTGIFENDWVVIETDNAPTTSPLLSDSGIHNNLLMEIDLKSRYEEDGTGFNYGKPSNFESKPTMTVFVQKPTSSEIITLENGCADVEVHTLVGNVWNTGIDNVISNTPSVSKSNFCVVEFESEHYSKKSISSKNSSPSTSSESSNSGNSGGSGRVDIDTGQSIMTMPKSEVQKNYFKKDIFPRWIKNPMEWWINDQITYTEMTNIMQFMAKKTISGNPITIDAEHIETKKIIAKMWIAGKVDDSSLRPFWE